MRPRRQHYAPPAMVSLAQTKDDPPHPFDLWWVWMFEPAEAVRSKCEPRARELVDLWLDQGKRMGLYGKHDVRAVTGVSSPAAVLVPIQAGLFDEGSGKGGRS